MKVQNGDPLLTTGRVIVLLAQTILAVGAAALTIGFPIVIFANGAFTEELRSEFSDPSLVFPTLPVLGLMAVALMVVVLAFYFLQKIRQVIDTVAEGDPFVPENSERLTTMAWLMLAIQILAIPAVLLAVFIESALQDTNTSLDASLDLNGIVMVVTLFILARVFRQGTSMREDLEGTV